jgi:hypothetical protein
MPETAVVLSLLAALASALLGGELDPFSKVVTATHLVAKIAMGYHLPLGAQVSVSFSCHREEHFRQRSRPRSSTVQSSPLA